MRQLKKAITGILMFFGMLLTTGGLPGNVYAATSYSVISNETAHTYDISREQYSAILSALREAAAAGASEEQSLKAIEAQAAITPASASTSLP